MLEVRMLGAFAISSGGRMRHGSLGSKGRRLVAYLLTYPNRSHRRDHLAELFWENEDANCGRNALNTALWRLRNILSDCPCKSNVRPVSVADDIVLELEDPAIVDVHRFQRVAKTFLEAAERTACSGGMIDAFELYQGRYLDGEDDLWVIEERERLLCLYIRVLTKLMHQFANASRYEDALECGRLILREDPLRELVQRNVMLLYVLNGQQAEAIQQFNRCRKTLWNECHVRPMPQTEELADLVRSGSIFNDLPQLTQTSFGLREAV
jgi:DNA-binding SARP family transcriptional activator